MLSNKKKIAIIVASCTFAVVATVTAVLCVLFIKPNSSSANGVVFARVPNGYVVTAYRGNDKDVVIPDNYLGIPIVGIQKDAFNAGKRSQNAEIESVFIPDSVSYIEDRAFYYCTSLSKINLNGKYLKSVGQSAFAECYLLMDVTFGERIEDVGMNAFLNTGMWQEYQTNEIATQLVRGGVLLDVKNPSTNVNLVLEGSDITVIGADAFRGKNISNNVTIAYKNLRGISSFAFDECPLSSLTFNCSSLKHIGDFAFSNKNIVELNSLPEGLIDIGEGAFQNCTYLQLVVLPNSVESIGDFAFSGCKRISEVTVSAETANLDDAFDGAFGDRMLTVIANGEDNFSTSFVDAFADYATSLVVAGNFEPSTFKSRNIAKFEKLVSLEIDCKIASRMPNFALDVENLKLRGDSTENAKYTANSLYIFPMLKELYLDGVSYIGDFAFADLRYLEFVSIGEDGTEYSQITDIGVTAFEDTPWLNSKISSLNVSNKSFVLGNVLLGVYPEKNIVVPNVKKIDVGAFDRARDIVETVVIPASVEVIYGNQTRSLSYYGPIGYPSNAEYHYAGLSRCSKLHTVNIEENSKLREVGDGAFSNSLRLANFVAVKKFAVVGENETHDEYFNIGSSLVLSNMDILGKNVFYGTAWCSSVSNEFLRFGSTCIVQFVGTPNANMVIPFGVRVIAGGTLSNKSQLVNVTIPDSVVFIGENAFGSCQNLLRVELGSGVKVLEKTAFNNCTSLIEIVIKSNAKLDLESSFGIRALSANINRNFALSIFVARDSIVGYRSLEMYDKVFVQTL